MGHFSMKISAPTGSILGGTQQVGRITKYNFSLRRDILQAHPEIGGYLRLECKIASQLKLAPFQLCLHITLLSISIEALLVKIGWMLS
jgi:hypothetical protein